MTNDDDLNMFNPGLNPSYLMDITHEPERKTQGPRGKLEKDQWRNVSSEGEMLQNRTIVFIWINFFPETLAHRTIGTPRGAAQAVNCEDRLRNNIIPGWVHHLSPHVSS